MADRDKITQVVTNLASNAVKYAPDGGEIVLMTRAEGNHAHLMVIDNGLGMPKDMLEHVFEPYSRVENGTTRRHRGPASACPSPARSSSCTAAGSGPTASRGRARPSTA